MHIYRYDTYMIHCYMYIHISIHVRVYIYIYIYIHITIYIYIYIYTQLITLIRRVAAGPLCGSLAALALEQLQRLRAFSFHY